MADVHSGHRERLKRQFMNNGLDGFTDVQALELLLFYAIPRKDTNPIAHALLERFGSLSQVLEAEPEELEKIPGISTHAAGLIRLVTAFSRRYQVDRAQKTVVLKSVDEIGRYLTPFFFGRKQETVFLLCLDAKCKVLACKELGEGGINSVAVSPRRVVETALSTGATTVVLAHNHPSGLAVPSVEDAKTTGSVAAALETVEVCLADHIIVADGEFVSMVQSGYRWSAQSMRKGAY